MDKETNDAQIINEPVKNSVNLETTEDCSDSVDTAVLETIVVIRSSEEDSACVSGESGDLIQSEVKSSVLGFNKVSADELKFKDLKYEKDTCVIDVKYGGGFDENLDGEKICRICHLSSDQSIETSSATGTAYANAIDLIQLGCECKDELGIAHSHCAEAWFKLKGNRLCEICGETAKSVTGVGDNIFMEEWSGRRSSGSGTNLSERRGGCWQGQSFWNFLMACLVIAFVLPWFFRVNML